jgi:hypothetical protein
MSADQFSEKPLPQQKHCRYCGAETTSSEAACTTCREKFALEEGPPDAHGQRSGPPAPEKQRATWGGNPGWVIAGGFTIGVCVAFAFETPGILIVLLGLAAPALIRTLIVSQRQQGGTSLTIGRLVVIFLSWLGIASMIGVALAVAFVAICSAVWRPTWH